MTRRRNTRKAILAAIFLSVACDSGTTLDLRDIDDAGADSDTGSDAGSPAQESFAHRYARYSFQIAPTQAEVSDLGPTDYEYDLGDLHLYALSAEGASYQPTAGAEVNLAGVAFELPPGALIQSTVKGSTPVEEPQTIRVFKAPLDSWRPPFARAELDALYYIAPHWAKLAGEGVALTLEPPVGWQEGDTGPLYLLGDLAPGLGGMAEPIFKAEESELLCVNGDEAQENGIPAGTMERCGVAQYRNGRIETSLIPRFTWVGIGRPESADAGVGTSSESGESCIASVRGRLLRDSSVPWSGTVAFCTPGTCHPADTGTNGAFFWRVPNAKPTDCRTFDFGAEYLRLEISSTANPNE